MVETSNFLSMNFSRKYSVSGRYFIVGVKIAGCWHILTGLMVSSLTHCRVHECCKCKLQQNSKWHNSADVIHRAVKLWYDEVYLTLNSRISLVIIFSLLSPIQFLWCYMGLREFGAGSTNNHLIDIFLYSHHLSAWCCI